MNKQRLEILFQRYLAKTATASEKDEFFELVREPGSTEILQLLSERHAVNMETLIQMPAESSQQILEAVLASENPVNKSPLYVLRPYRRRILRYAAAAVLLLAVSTLMFIIRTGKKEKTLAENKPANIVIKDVPPGHTGAILLLANGETIVLDTAKNGTISDGFTKTPDAISVKKTSIEWATLITQLGRQQQIVLSDGTKVWLNAGSSIKFPVSFTGAERRVEITGEAYFEVAHNAAMPFFVKAGKQEISVLGTHFNVNAYDDEPGIKTTLLEGSVKINNETLLNPGQQFSNGVVSKANLEASVAWVHGYFQFDHADIETVMRQLSRWYDVEVRFEGTPTAEKFGGEIQRNLQLSEVMELLSTLNIHYTINEKSIIIHK